MKEYVLSYSDALYEFGVDVISSLQSAFPGDEKFFMEISHLFDPKYVFTLYFPFIYALNWALGAKLLATVVVVEWTNQILKWLMKGERPYWWVHEHEADLGHTLETETHHLLQCPATCETGPGSPSGHSMAMSAVWFVVVRSIIDVLVNPSNRLSTFQKKLISRVLWTIYAVFQTLIITSRLYLAAHFPHQCILGVFLGVIVANLVYKSSSWLTLDRQHWLAVAALIMGSATATYWLLLVSGSDPSWSIRRAVKWCDKREYIHVDTTPFYSLVRYSGAGLGLGLGLTSRYFYQTDRNAFGHVRTITLAALGLALGEAADYAHFKMPADHEAVFYLSEFVLNTALPYSVIALLPYLIMKVTPGAKAQHAKQS